MYKVVTFEESVRVPPNLFGMKIQDAALQMLREQYERTVQRDMGVIIALMDVDVKGEGRIIPGDGAAYFNVTCEALVFYPQVGEIVDGAVTEIVEFGAFVRLGPIDGLVHVSQIANDYFTYDRKNGYLIGRETRKTLKKGDSVRAKIATVSIKDSIPASKIALTMRPDGMGRSGEGKKGRKGDKDAGPATGTSS